MKAEQNDRCPRRMQTNSASIDNHASSFPMTFVLDLHPSSLRSFPRELFSTSRCSRIRTGGRADHAAPDHAAQAEAAGVSGAAIPASAARREPAAAAVAASAVVAAADGGHRAVGPGPGAAEHELEGFGGVLGSQEAPVAAALVFDTAPRMEYRHENKTRLEVARELAPGCWRNCRGKARSPCSTPAAGRSEFSADRGVAKQRIERLETVTNSQPLARSGRGGRAAARQERAGAARKFTCSPIFPGRPGPSDAAAALQDRLAAVHGVAVYLIDVGVGSRSISPWARCGCRTRSCPTAARWSRRPTCACLGPGGQRTVELRLWKTPSRGSRPSSCKPGESRQVEFRVDGLTTGTHQGFVRIVGPGRPGRRRRALSSPSRSSRPGRCWWWRRSRRRPRRCSSPRPWRRRCRASAGRPASIAA